VPLTSSSIEESSYGLPHGIDIMFHTHPNVGYLDPNDPVMMGVGGFGFSLNPYTAGFSPTDFDAERTMIKFEGHIVPMAAINFQGGGDVISVTLLQADRSYSTFSVN
jgi:hypothetical protein